MTFKYVLLLFLSGFLVYVLMLPRRRIYRRAIILVVLAIMSVFAMRPDWSTTVAAFLGVGRGADLLFYISHLALGFVAFAYYLKFKDLETKITQIVRTLAINFPKKQ